MKLFRKMLLVVLFLGMMMPLYSATENPKPEEKNPLSEFECPECGKKVDMAKEIKKLEKKLKKSKKKSKKKKNKKKDKAKDSEKSKDKKADEQQPFLPKKMKCPKCKKMVPLTTPDAEKAEKAEAGKTEAENGDSK